VRQSLQKGKKIALLFLGFLFLVGLGTVRPGERDPLKVSIQPKDISSKTGAQRIIVWVENASNQTFTGRLFFELRDTHDELLDFSSLDIRDLAPGRRIYEITWFKFPSRIGEYVYRYGGRFADESPRRGSLEYREIGREGGATYMTFSIFTSCRTRTEIEQIVDIYKRKYSDLHGMNIRFYGDRSPLVADTEGVVASAGHETATYTLIRSKGFENLRMLE